MKLSKNHSFHIVKREPPVWYIGLAIRAAAVILALIVSGVIITLLTDKNPIAIYASMIDGAFGMDIRIWSLFQDVAILLCISLAVTPAFKMKFWNCGAEGQVLIGGLATVAVMMFLGDKLPLPILLIIMIAASIIASIIWAVLPAIFKAYWNTNETLFTLMMNYVAIQFVSYFLKSFVVSEKISLKRFILFPIEMLSFSIFAVLLRGESLSAAFSSRFLPKTFLYTVNPDIYNNKVAFFSAKQSFALKGRINIKIRIIRNAAKIAYINYSPVSSASSFSCTNSSITSTGLKG